MRNVSIKNIWFIKKKYQSKQTVFNLRLSLFNNKRPGYFQFLESSEQFSCNTKIWYYPSGANNPQLFNEKNNNSESANLEVIHNATKDVMVK